MKGVSDKKHSTSLSFESKNIINPLCTMVFRCLMTSFFISLIS